MGLALDDFLKLTPFEFAAARNAYYKNMLQAERVRWMQAGWTAFKMVCPGGKKSYAFSDFIPSTLTEQPQKVTKKLSAAEQEKRFRELAKKFN